MNTFGISDPFTPEYSYRYLVGREREFDLLKNSVLVKKERVIAISGNNATGKTSLWRTFLEKHKNEFDNKFEVIYSYPYHQEFPKINSRIRLVVIEELSFDFTPEIEGKVNFYINKYPHVQFILVGTSNEFLEKFKPSSHIHLGPLPDYESTRLLLDILESKLPEKEIIKITRLANGQPFLLKLIAQYLNENKYDIDEISKLINENIHYQGLLKKTGSAILEASPEFQHISNDILIVNKSILDKIRLNPNDIYGLTPRQFEEMVAELMIKRGYQVDLTKTTRDGGKDLIIANHTDIGNFMYYVECKKYAATNPVGVNLVRELAGTISADRVTAGIMITSSYFSPDAIQFSEKFRHQISLIDFIKLKEWLKNCGSH